MGNPEIIFIYDPDCTDCRRMKNILVDTLELLGATNYVTITEYSSDDDKAVDVAVTNGIYDIPGCTINGKSFYGKNFDAEGIKEAIKSMV